MIQSSSTLHYITNSSSFDLIDLPTLPHLVKYIPLICFKILIRIDFLQDSSTMAVTFLRILLAPVLIVTATMLGRRFGPGASGWFIGFPIISGPISLVLATTQGHEFAVNAALGTLGGQASICLFCAVYFLAARKLPWWLTAPLAIVTFMVSAFLWNNFHPALIPSLAVLVGLILFLGRAIPARKIQHKPLNLWWDLPARILISILFVTGVTTFATKLGPQLSGLFSTLPIFATILSTFTHAQQGGLAAGQLMRGTIVGSIGIAAFYLVIATLLPLTGSLWVYLLAAMAALLANGVSWHFTKVRV
jgi:hypothetical protein